MKKYLFISFLIVLLSFLFGYNAKASDLTDKDGVRIHFDRPFTRIIPLYGAHTENLCSLGLDQEIIGRTRGDDSPSAISQKPVFSDRDNPEKFIAARPDLILIRPMISRGHPKLIAELRRAGITIVSLQPNNVREMYAYWMDLGRLTGKTGEAASMIKKFKNELSTIQKRYAALPIPDRPKVYFEAIHAKMRTFSPDSISIFCLSSAGGVNIASDAHQRHGTNIADYGKERLLSHAEDIDVFLAQFGRMNRVDKATIMNEPGFQAIKAVRNNQVYLINEKQVSRPTMRLIQGIQKINALLYH